MNKKDIIDKILPVLKKHRIKKAGLFGSYSRQSCSDRSDIDILVELGGGLSLLDFIKIKLELEDLLHKKVDLVEYDSIKPGLKDSILQEETRIYG